MLVVVVVVVVVIVVVVLVVVLGIISGMHRSRSGDRAGLLEIVVVDG